MLIIKRDGSKQSFDRNKIKKSILACFEAADERSISEVDTITDAIVTCLECQDFADGLTDQVTVSQVQICTERTLIEYAYHEAATAFMGYRIEKDILRESRRKPDALALSHYIHQAKYARWDDEAGKREDYHGTVDRVIEMHYDKFCGEMDKGRSPWFHDPVVFAARSSTIQKEITDAFRYVYTKSVLPSMRSMQFAGPAMDANNARMYNCCFTHIDREEAFGEALFLLLSGCGVGYSVQWEHIDLLPTIQGVSKRDVKHHTISDTIEGWSHALTTLVRSYMANDRYKFGYYIEFDYSEIRGEGVPLKRSGGKAPGHLGLKAMLEEVRTVLDSAVGRRLRPLEAHDMMCYTARAVLSGGIRRSSMIALFSSSDTEMMYCKARGVFDPAGNLNLHRAMANNACVLIRDTAPRSQYDRIIDVSSGGFGDPSYVFLGHPDEGINPCGEIILNPRMKGYKHAGFAFCNLTEINGSNCSSKEEFLKRCDAAAVIGTLQSCFTRFPFLAPCSQAIAERDRLIGVSITGIMDNPKVMDWLRDGRDAVEGANARVASILEINTSDRCCCIKPSGTASLLLGTSSGIHCHHSRRYLRRVTCNRTESIAGLFRATNPHMIEEKPNGDYVIVFPVQARDDAIVDLSGVDFVKRVLRVRREWCGSTGHNVSCTVQVSGNDVAEIMDLIWKSRDDLTSLAFAPHDISTRYPFAPLEAVEGSVLEAYWDLLIKEYKLVDYTPSTDDVNPSATAACEGEKCAVT